MVEHQHFIRFGLIDGNVQYCSFIITAIKTGCSIILAGLIGRRFFLLGSMNASPCGVHPKPQPSLQGTAVWVPSPLPHRPFDMEP